MIVIATKGSMAVEMSNTLHVQEPGNYIRWPLYSHTKQEIVAVLNYIMNRIVYF